MLFLCFLIYPATKSGRSRQPGVVDLVLSILGGASAFYVAYTYQDIVDRGGFPTQTDIIVGSIFCLMILEAARRTMGMFLIVLAAIFLGYLFVGPWMPGILGHGGFTYDRVIRQMYMTTEVSSASPSVSPLPMSICSSCSAPSCRNPAPPPSSPTSPSPPQAIPRAARPRSACWRAR